MIIAIALFVICIAATITLHAGEIQLSMWENAGTADGFKVRP